MLSCASPKERGEGGTGRPAPGLIDLAGTLAGVGDPAALSELWEKFPTGALAVLSFTGAWSQLGHGCAYLEPAEKAGANALTSVKGRKRSRGTSALGAGRVSCQPARHPTGTSRATSEWTLASAWSKVASRPPCARASCAK